MAILHFLMMLFFSTPLAFGAQGGTIGGKAQFSVSAAGYGGGGRFTSIAIDPRNPRIILIGSDVSGVFKSEDGGDHFDLKGEGLETFAVADIAFHPLSSTKVFLLTDKGFYISEDQGESWKMIREEIQYRSRIFGSHLMVFSKHSLWVGTEHKGVFQIALDRLPHSILPVPGLEGIKINGLAIYQGRLYAATSQGVHRYEGGRWQAWNEGLPKDQKEILDIAAHPKLRLYVTEKNSGLYVWNEKKGAWKHRSAKKISFSRHTPKTYKAVTLQPDDPDKVFLATFPEDWVHMLFKSTDGGNSWKNIKDFRLSPEAAENWPVAKSINGVEEITFTPKKPGELYMTDWWNVWKSGDEGVRWSQLHKGLQNTFIYDIEAHRKDAKKIFLAVADNGFMVSEDGGKSWKRKMSGVFDGHAQEIEISRQNPLKVYLLMNPWGKKDRVYVYKSLDGGETWKDISFPVPQTPLPPLGYVDGVPTNLEIDPLSDETVYVGTNGYGIFKTNNGGMDWEAVNNGLKTPYLKGSEALLIHPKNSDILFASTQNGGVYKTTNGGRAWTSISKNHTWTFGMAMDPSNPARILAGCPNKKLILSEDEGGSWQEIQLPGDALPHIAPFAIAFHPVHTEMVLVGTLAYELKASDGLYISQNGGRSFEKFPLPRNLPRVPVFDLAFSVADESKGFIGFGGIGLYQITIKR
ncbi:MAG: hypothetical protein V1930_00860 [Pseudomonadota bacterium]